MFDRVPFYKKTRGSRADKKRPGCAQQHLPNLSVSLIGGLPQFSYQDFQQDPLV